MLSLDDNELDELLEDDSLEELLLSSLFSLVLFVPTVSESEESESESDDEDDDEDEEDSLFNVDSLRITFSMLKKN